MSRILGVDFGTKRVGLAISDGLGVLASPLEVVPRESVVDYVKAVAIELEVTKIIVGLPTALGGHEGASADEARALGRDLHYATELPVVYHDERFTSRMAETALLGKGMKRRDRREKVDKIAAAIILQDYLDNQ
ncbi:MAG: Holliday junction resolvase RuvX [Acidimicrobiia bacterium]